VRGRTGFKWLRTVSSSEL